MENTQQLSRMLRRKEAVCKACALIDKNSDLRNRCVSTWTRKM